MFTQQISATRFVLRKVWSQEEGQDLVEYVLLFMLVVVAAIVGITAFGERVLALYNSVVGTF